MSFMADVFKPSTHQIEAQVREPISTYTDVMWTPPPAFASSNTKPAPARLAGIRYENRVRAVLSSHLSNYGFILHSHRWIYFNDSYAQPDFILVSPSGSAIIFEVKYTYTDTSSQRKLYEQLLERLGFWPITSCTICHNLTAATPRDKIIHDFHDIEQDSVWQLRK